MAEAIGVAASIISVLQLSGTIIDYLNDVRSASNGCNKIFVEISSIRGFLYSLKDLATRIKSGEISLSTVKSLDIPNGPLT